MPVPYSIDERWTIKKFEDAYATTIELENKEFKLSVIKDGGNDWARAILNAKESVPRHKREFTVTFNFNEYLSKNKTSPAPYDLIEKAQFVLIEEGVLFGKPMMEMVFEGTKE